MGRRLTPEQREERAINNAIKKRMRAIAKAERDERNRLERERIDNNKREQAKKKAIKIREAWLRKQKRINDKADRLHGVYHAMLGLYQAAMTSTTTSCVNYQVYGRLIGTHIFELNPRFMGWKSDAYLAAREKQKQETGKALSPTDEHIYPRQFDGEFLLCHMITMGGMSWNEFLDYVDVFTQVAHVMPNENTSLIEYQKSHTFVSPEDAYEKAGIAVKDCGTECYYRRLEDVAPQKVLHAYFGRRVHA